MNAIQKHLIGYLSRRNAPTQGQLAAAIGINRVNLNRIIRGRSNPSMDTAERIAIATGRSLAAILRQKVPV